MASLFGRIRRALAGPPPARTPAPVAPTPRSNDYFFLGEGLGMARLRNGLLIFVDPRDESVCSHLIARGYWEEWVEKTVLALLSPGDHVIEIGSHVGYYTLAMAHKVGPTGRITSYDANPRMADLAGRSLKLNGMQGWARVRNRAVSDKSGYLPIVTSIREGGGGHIYVHDNAFGADTQTIEVEAVRLDKLNLPDARLIRIDAEGSEALILRGAEPLLARPDVVMCIEWDVRQMESRSDVPAFVAWLVGLGFQFWRIRHDAVLEPLSADTLATLPNCDMLIARQHPFDPLAT